MATALGDNFAFNIQATFIQMWNEETHQMWKRAAQAFQHKATWDFLFSARGRHTSLV